MAADQQFCLRWNNHQSTLISVFDTLLENGTLVDCTLAAEGQYLKAHKVVLSACSPYMETLLSQNYDKHPILILKDVKFTELKSMMDYMYRGEVNISQDQLGTFLKAAESLQIKGLSENGEGDARDVGSTNANPPPPRRPPATRPEPEAAQSPAHRSRDGSVSPSSRKRRRLRRNSDDGDNHIESNSCDVPAQSTPVPNIPASITTTPIRTPIVKPEVNDRLDHNTLPAESGLLKEKIEPAEPLLEPKTEYLEDLNNDDSVEDLTLDDDDEMDMSQMSNLSNMSRPGPSHGADLSNQGFPPWQLGNQSGTDEVFMAAQEAVNAHRDSQDAVAPVIVEVSTLETILPEPPKEAKKVIILTTKKQPITPSTEMKIAPVSPPKTRSKSSITPTVKMPSISPSTPTLKTPSSSSTTPTLKILSSSSITPTVKIPSTPTTTPIVKKPSTTPTLTTPSTSSTPTPKKSMVLKKVSPAVLSPKGKLTLKQLAMTKHAMAMKKNPNWMAGWFQCKKCMNCYESKNRYESHLKKRCNQDKMYPCPHCTVEMPYNDLLDHINITHMGKQ